MVGAPTRFGSRDADEAALGDGRARRAQGDEPAPRSVAPTHLSSSTAQDPARDVATPDGRVYAAGASDAPLAAIGRVIARGGRIVGKGIMTVWRLAGALDAALWHGVKFAARAFAEVLLSSLRLLAAIAVDLIRWLPSRYGRAYCAASGVVLAVSSLWIIDEMRRAASMTPDGRARIAAPPLNLDDPILAQVRGRYVHLSDVAAAARAAGDLETDEALEPRDAFSRGFVDQYVDERLLADAATSVGLSRNPMVARRIRAARDHVLAAAYLDAQIQAASTPETIARLYEQQADIVTRGDEVRARHILVRTEDEAREILAALKDGYDFKKMARERSIDRATAPLGGEIGYFTREMMSPPLSRAAFATPKGDYARLFFTEHGWHILQVVDRRETVRPPLEDFSDQIRRYLELRTLAETLNELRRQNEVVYFRSSLEPPAPSAALTAPVSPEASDGQTVGPRDADAEASTHSQ